jgi:hypothetical protein
MLAYDDDGGELAVQLEHCKPFHLKPWQLLMAI